MALAFPTPQFLLLPDTSGIRNYGNLTNAMSVDIGSDRWTVPVSVPTGIFTIMREVLQVPPECPAALYVDLDDLDSDNVVYLFGIAWGDDHCDLWSYSKAGIPAWILAREYRC